MATPTNRTPVRIARGSTSALTTGISDIQEGEIVWDTTTNKLKVKEGVALEESNPAADATKADLASPTFTGTPASTTAAVSTNTTQIATTAFVVAEIADEVGTTVQAYDADLTSLSSCQTGGAAALAALTSTEIEVLDGATLSTDELNLLDGVTSTTTELNYTDGVTSGIQAQLTARALLNTGGQYGGGQEWDGGQRGSFVTYTDASTIGASWYGSNNYKVTLGGNRDMTSVDADEAIGQSGSIFITQDATGSRTLSWASDFKWVGGTAPTLTTTAGATDRVDYIILSATEIHCVISLDVK